MISKFIVTKTESQTFDSDIKIRQHSINVEINLRNPKIIDKSLRVDFAYAITYFNPSVGNIRFEGYCDYFNNTDLSDIVNNWEQGTSPEIRNEIANFTINNLVPISIFIARTMGLPSPIQIPHIDFTKPKTSAKPDNRIYG